MPRKKLRWIAEYQRHHLSLALPPCVRTSSRNFIFSTTLGSMIGGNGRPVMTTARPLQSEKSRPSLTWQISVQFIQQTHRLGRQSKARTDTNNDNNNNNNDINNTGKWLNLRDDSRKVGSTGMLLSLLLLVKCTDFSDVVEALYTLKVTNHHRH